MESTEIYTSNNLISTPNLMSTPQSAILGFWDLDTNEHLTLNHLLLTFKLRMCELMQKCANDAKRRKKFNKKWKMFLINVFKLTNF